MARNVSAIGTCVFPGEWDTLATALSDIALSRLDLPTFDRPAKSHVNVTAMQLYANHMLRMNWV